MEKLSCSARCCINNINGLCSAKAIHIRGVEAYSSSGTFCNTYEFNKFSNTVSNITNVNFFGAITQPFTNNIMMSPEIACDAVKCTHNNRGFCDAKDVYINGEYSKNVNEITCQTFNI